MCNTLANRFDSIWYLWSNGSVLSHFSHVWLFATLWTVARQVSPSMRFSRPRILEWVAMPSSRGSSPPRNWTCLSYVSSTGRWVLYRLGHLGSPFEYLLWAQEKNCATSKPSISWPCCFSQHNLHFPLKIHLFLNISTCPLKYFISIFNTLKFSSVWLNKKCVKKHRCSLLSTM